jgi:hypothetical protein
LPSNTKIGDSSKNWWPNQDWQILWSVPRLRTLI